MSSNVFLYPHVTSLPVSNDVANVERSSGNQKGVSKDFDLIFEKELENQEKKIDLSQIRNPLKFSAHASQRLRDRNIILDPPSMERINRAVDRAELKGVQDTLILTQDAALIVNIKNRTVVTALDRKSTEGNIFTNIDGAVII
jgi:flagellar operon protein